MLGRLRGGTSTGSGVGGEVGNEVLLWEVLRGAGSQVSEPGGQGPPRGADTTGQRVNPARPKHRRASYRGCQLPGGGGGHVDWESQGGTVSSELALN